MNNNSLSAAVTQDSLILLLTYRYLVLCITSIMSQCRPANSNNPLLPGVN